MRALIATIFFCFLAYVADAQPIVFTPLKPSGIYDVGEKAGWNITLAPNATAGNFNYTVKKNNQDTVKTGTLDLASGNASIDVTLNEPAMLYVQLTPVSAATPQSPDAAPST